MATSTARKRSHCDYTQEPVAIRVGSEGKIFKLNPTILSNNSKFFQTALSDSWNQVPFQNTFFNLPDVDVETFHHYANWCHQGNIEAIIEHFDSGSDPKDDKQFFRHLTNIYILAEYLDDKLLRNAIMDKILDVTSTSALKLDISTMALAFSNLPETSTLARFLVDQSLSGRTRPEWLVKYYRELPPDYVKALLLGWAKRAYSQKESLERPADVVQCVPCTYHEHDEEVPQGEKCMRIVEMAMKPQAPKALVKKKRATRMLDLA